MMGPAEKLVVRYADGRLLKGYSYDFTAGRRRFHVFSASDASGEPAPILLSELKAVFFVRAFAGNRQYAEKKRFADGARFPGRRVEITFQDGEVLVGATNDDDDLCGRPGIFFTPADPASNNLRVYAVSGAIRRIRSLPVDRPTAMPVRTTRPQPQPPPPLPKRVLAWLRQPILLPRPRLRRRTSP
jgi:hypothetical protein